VEQARAPGKGPDFGHAGDGGKREGTSEAVLKIASVTVAGIDLMTPASSIRERAMPDDLGGTVIRLAVCGRSLDQAEAPAWRHRERLGVVGSGR
jgi:hypothetical protein